jgi:hypothetical protein
LGTFDERKGLFFYYIGNPDLEYVSQILLTILKDLLGVQHYDNFVDFVKDADIFITKMTFYTKDQGIYAVNIDYKTVQNGETLLTTHKMKSTLEIPRKQLKRVELFLRENDRIRGIDCLFGEHIHTLRFTTDRNKVHKVNRVKRRVKKKIDVCTELEMHEAIAFVNAGFRSEFVFDF